MYNTEHKGELSSEEMNTEYFKTQHSLCLEE